MFFMAWLAASIFISFFAPSLSVLAFGEAMCGISWGVFQVIYLLPNVPLLFHLIRVYPDSHNYLRMWGCPDCPPTLRHFMGLYVLGRRHPLFLWSHSWLGKSAGRRGLAISICNAMDLASPAVYRRVLCSRVAMELCSTRQDRGGDTQSNASHWRFSRKGGRSGGCIGLYSVHNRDGGRRDWKRKHFWMLPWHEFAPHRDCEWFCSQPSWSFLADWVFIIRTALSGLAKFLMEILSWATLSFSSKPLASARSKPSTLTSLSLPASLLAVSHVGSSSPASAVVLFTFPDCQSCLSR